MFDVIAQLPEIMIDAPYFTYDLIFLAFAISKYKKVYVTFLRLSGAFCCPSRQSVSITRIYFDNGT